MYVKNKAFKQIKCAFPFFFLTAFINMFNVSFQWMQKNVLRLKYSDLLVICNVRLFFCIIFSEQRQQALKIFQSIRRNFLFKNSDSKK